MRIGSAWNKSFGRLCSSSDPHDSMFGLSAYDFEQLMFLTPINGLGPIGA